MRIEYLAVVTLSVTDL